MSAKIAAIFVQREMSCRVYSCTIDHGGISHPALQAPIAYSGLCNVYDTKRFLYQSPSFFDHYDISLDEWYRILLFYRELFIAYHHKRITNGCHCIAETRCTQGRALVEDSALQLVLGRCQGTTQTASDAGAIKTVINGWNILNVPTCNVYPKVFIIKKTQHIQYNRCLQCYDENVLCEGVCALGLFF